MDNVPFTIEEENLICIYHKYDRRRTIAAISDALPDMDADIRPLAGTVKYYAQIHLQVWQNSVCTGQGNLPLIT